MRSSWSTTLWLDECAAAGGQYDVEIRDYLRIARRRWLLIAGCFLACVGIAALVTFRAVPQYSSTAKLFVSTPSTDASQVFAGGTFTQQRVTSYADLVGNREVRAASLARR